MLNKKFWFCCYIQKVMSGSNQGDVLTCIDWALRSPLYELGWAWISCNLHLRETNFKLKNVGFGLSLESSWQACFHGIIALHQFSIPHKFECCEGFSTQSTSRGNKFRLGQCFKLKNKRQVVKVHWNLFPSHSDEKCCLGICYTSPTMSLLF